MCNLESCIKYRLVISKLAQRYIQNLKGNVEFSRDEVNQIFELHQIPTFQIVVDFCAYFGDKYYDFYGINTAYLSIFDSIGYPKSVNNTVLRYDFREKEYRFFLNPTEGPFNVFINEKGEYFEDYEMVSTSIFKKVEDLAMHWECRNDFALQDNVLDIDGAIFNSIVEKFSLNEQASDRFVKWYNGQNGALRKQGNQLTLFMGDRLTAW